jgi:hypothetical protein
MVVKDYLLANLEQLPENLQLEILHYSAYLVSRYATKNSTQTQEKKRGGLGILKGKIWMSDNFDEPLEDLAEYM